MESLFFLSLHSHPFLSFLWVLHYLSFGHALYEKQTMRLMKIHFHGHQVRITCAIKLQALVPAHCIKRDEHEDYHHHQNPLIIVLSLSLSLPLFLLILKNGSIGFSISIPSLFLAIPSFCFSIITSCFFCTLFVPS